jgi:plasmid stabilization system protein ParE
VNYWLHGGAEDEHLARVRYYEAQRGGLGSKYLDDFDATMATICEAPHRYKLVRPPQVRLVSFRTFPCAVIYREMNDAVQVLALPHDRQRPGYWVTRL